MDYSGIVTKEMFGACYFTTTFSVLAPCRLM